MVEMSGASHFKCASCSNIKRINKKHIIRCEFPIYDGDTQKEYFCHVHYVPICNECYEDKNK